MGLPPGSKSLELTVPGMHRGPPRFLLVLFAKARKGGDPNATLTPWRGAGEPRAGVWEAGREVTAPSSTLGRNRLFAGGWDFTQSAHSQRSSDRASHRRNIYSLIKSSGSHQVSSPSVPRWR